MAQQPEVKMDLTGKIELSQDQIKQILTEFVMAKFPGMGEITNVKFTIDNPPVDYRGEYCGSPTLGKATVELSVPYNNYKFQKWQNRKERLLQSLLLT